MRGIPYKKWLWSLMAVSFVIRIFLSGTLEFGNDEVYYRLYALYPDWSYFDHPLMVAWIMRIFSLNLLFTSELFLRLGAVVLGTANLWLVFQIGKTLKDERTGLLAALLYSASIYAFVITGIFILPDAPQSFFSLLALHALIKSVPNPEEKSAQKQMLLFGLFAGLGILSKYTAVFLWFGAALYILFYQRKWLVKKSSYLAIIITFIVSLPILIWNIQNRFISFTFHGERVDMLGHSLNLNTFLTEIVGEIFYNNPINFVLIITAVTAFFLHKKFLKKAYGRILLLTGVPMIVLFILFSLFRSTLPHWTAPGYTLLLFMAAALLSEKRENVIPVAVKSAVGLLVVVLILGFVQIKTGLFYHDSSSEVVETGSNDPSLDLFGYRQAGAAFAKIVKQDTLSGRMSGKLILTGNNWFPLANFDYYAATPLQMKTLAIGPLQNIHEYAWINKKRGGFQKGMNAYYLTDTRYFRPPDKTMQSFFETQEIPDTIPVIRGGRIAKYVLVYRLKHLLKIPPDPLQKIE